MITGRRIHTRAAHAFVACLCISGLAACGTAQSPVTRPASRSVPVAPADETPIMVMVSLTSQGYHASDIDLAHGRQAMLMIVNHTSTTQTVQAPLPVTDQQTQDTSTWPPTATPGPGTLSIVIPPGHEVDDIFVAGDAGTYELTDGSTPMGAVVVS